MSKSKVAFLCDGKSCGYPPPEGCMVECFHTKKVEHAKNFHLMEDGSGYWAEKTDKERSDDEWFGR